MPVAETLAIWRRTAMIYHRYAPEIAELIEAIADEVERELAKSDTTRAHIARGPRGRPSIEQISRDAVLYRRRRSSCPGSRSRGRCSHGSAASVTPWPCCAGRMKVKGLCWTKDHA
jgi:hypothetical protein